MKFDIMTLFPGLLSSFFETGLMGQAVQKGIIHYTLVNIRDFSKDRTKRVDNTLYGGGAGMLLRADVMERAYRSLEAGTTILLSARGRRLNQRVLSRLREHRRLILICGHYEGIDERFTKSYVHEEISIGDYVLGGGDVAAMVLIEGLSRYEAGFMGNEASLREESFEGSLLEYDQYTRPEKHPLGHVPSVLLSGHHAKIKAWRYENQVIQTYRRRPDLWKQVPFSSKNHRLILRFLRRNQKTLANDRYAWYDDSGPS